MQRGLLAAALCVGALGGTAAPLTIAERGAAPTFAIIVGDTPSPSRQYAAEELRDWTRCLTGVALPIAASRPAGMAGVFLDEPDAVSGLGDEGFRLHVAAGDLHIVGGRRGILYGVYELLEEYGGIGWYASWRTVVPDTGRLAVPGDLDDTQIPAFGLRGRGWYDLQHNPDFACRLRLNGRATYFRNGQFDERHGGTAWRQSGGGHSLGRLLPASEYGKSHPGYFAEINGVRQTRDVQPCLTNPDVLEIVTSNLFAVIRADPGANAYDVTQNDYDRYCTCARCRAVDEEEGSHAGTLIRFVNAIADRVEREFPGKQVTTFAYRYTRHPPKKTRPRANVVVKLCPAECEYSAPICESRYAENVAFAKDLDGWAAISPPLYIFDYAVNFRAYLHPFPNAPVFFANLRSFRDAGARYYAPLGNCEGLHADFGELKAWLLAKGMWNPDRDWRPLAAQFIRGYYGEAAAPFVQEVFDLLNAPPMDEKAHPALIYEDAWNTNRVSDAALERAAALWTKAEAAAAEGDPECFHNVRMGAAGVTYSRLERMLLGRKTAWATLHPERFASDPRLPELLDAMEQYAEETGGLLRYREHKRYHDEVVARLAAAHRRPPAPEKPSTTALILADDLEIDPVTHCQRIDDATALGGRACAILNSRHGWCLRFRFRNLAYDPGVLYRVRAHVRAEKTGNIGDVFEAGLYDRTQSPAFISNKTFSANQMPNDYEWYDLGELSPSDWAIVWFSAARQPPPGTPKASDRVWVDAIEISRLP
ncbi:MAG: DUF4838 domain-containing protein [Kiritimatiellae bacterium]|nr:DUF4838 domain-containing protein [Kiritimatiellia bacterium]